jgi:hypothetical protein
MFFNACYKCKLCIFTAAKIAKVRINRNDLVHNLAFSFHLIYLICEEKTKFFLLIFAIYMEDLIKTSSNLIKTCLQVQGRCPHQGGHPREEREGEPGHIRAAVPEDERRRQRQLGRHRA